MEKVAVSNGGRFWTENGNNNTYCQDNELTWLDWELDERKQAFLDFVKLATQAWRENPVLHAITR